MFHRAVDDSIATLKLIPDWFVKIKTIKKLFTALHADEKILYFNEDFLNVAYICNEMAILNTDLNNINLDYLNYIEDDLNTIILIRLLVWHIKFKIFKRFS